MFHVIKGAAWSFLEGKQWAAAVGVFFSEQIQHHKHIYDIF